MLIESFHSGPRGRRRYCSLHRPATRLVKSVGVVLCHPLGHEYYRAYRAYVKLAQGLAESGFPVLRFDYVGTGDSEGDGAHARLDDWISDVTGAARDLRQSEQLSGLVLGGMRFGGTLARLAAERIAGVSGVILWDAVEDGADYLAELQSLHAGMLADLERFRRARSAAACAPNEFVGATYARSFLEDVAGVSVAGKPDPTLRVFLAHSGPPPTVPTGTVDAPIDTGVDYGWNDRSRLEESIVDPATVNALTSRLNAALT